MQPTTRTGISHSKAARPARTRAEEDGQEAKQAATLTASQSEFLSMREALTQLNPPTAAPKTPSKPVATPTSKDKPINFFTPQEALETAGSRLTAFEKSEILEYEQIYFCGTADCEKIDAMPNSKNNCGFDDKHGDYQYKIGDHLEYRFQIMEYMGRGTFGAVVKAYDHKKRWVCAVKLIRNKKQFQKQAMNEVKILEKLMNADKGKQSNIVRVYGYFYFRNHLCISFELCNINLYVLMKRNNFYSFSLDLIRRITGQVLVSLNFLKQMHIVHCDIKPENILLLRKNRSQVRLIDFGSSCYEGLTMFTYVQSRFYRAPEVILELPYDCAIDMWSLGCCVCELYMGRPLFAGESEAEQLALICEVLGMPPDHMIAKGRRGKQHFRTAGLRPLPSDTRQLSRQQPRSNYELVSDTVRGRSCQPGSLSLRAKLKISDSHSMLVDFLSKVLVWDPAQRLGVADALQHPWVVSELKKVASPKPSPKSRVRPS